MRSNEASIIIGMVIAAENRKYGASDVISNASL
jgi:hypothetical protein